MDVSPGPAIRQRPDGFLHKNQILRLNQRVAEPDCNVKTNLRMGTVVLGVTNKMFWSEMHRDAMELAT